MASKTNFGSWNWNKGKNKGHEGGAGKGMDLAVIAPPSRPLTSAERYNRNVRSEMRAQGATTDPNMRPDVKAKILSVPFTSPLKGSKAWYPEKKSLQDEMNSPICSS